MKTPASVPDERSVLALTVCIVVHRQENPGCQLNEFFTIQVSVRLSYRSEVTQHKINFVKKCSQWGLN